MHNLMGWKKIFYFILLSMERVLEKRGSKKKLLPVTFPEKLWKHWKGWRGGLPEMTPRTRLSNWSQEDGGASGDCYWTFGVQECTAWCYPGNSRLPQPLLLQLSRHHGVNDSQRDTVVGKPHISTPLLTTANNKSKRKPAPASLRSSK